MGIVDFREHDGLEDGDDPEAAFLMRMMIDRGHGRDAMALALAWARTRGNRCFHTSFTPGNDAAKRFYESVGMCQTGRIVEGDVEMSVNLQRPQERSRPPLLRLIQFADG
ncbi:MAG: GNAT family N-acetyltransferase [Hyphomicrobiales bacterium]|nr:GNAT family N-acetyltransferase [Hyphomicrobiales bacterium]